MNDNLVTVFQGATLADAELVHQRLTDRKIEAIVDSTASPLDGLTSINQGTHVMCRQDDAAQAEQIIAEFLAEKAE